MEWERRRGDAVTILRAGFSFGQTDLRDFWRDIGHSRQREVARIAVLLEEGPAREYACMPASQVRELTFASDIAQRPDPRIRDRAQLVADLDAAIVIFDIAGFEIETVHDRAATDSYEELRPRNGFGPVLILCLDGDAASRS